MASRQLLLVSAPRGSGGSYAHLSRVLPRIVRLLPSWDVEVHAPAAVLRECFGADRAPWMRPLGGAGYAARLRLETVELPRRMRAEPRALVWAPFGPPLNPRLAPRTVWMSRNVLPLLPGRELEVSRVDRARIAVLRALVRLWARRARRTVCISEHARDRLSALAGIDTASIDVIPHGSDPPPAQPHCADRRLEEVRATRYVLHVGQPVPYRRTLELVQAYAALSERHPGVPPLVIAGKAREPDAAYERACLAVLEPLVQAGRACVLGQVSHADAIALMAGAEAFVYPSVHEDCPNVVLEALAAGRVGVYADIPAVRELAADAGIYVRDPRPEPLADALARALFDAPGRARIAAAALERAGRFTWDRTAERTAAALEAAV
jgi:glycosyltransferase involved in cell wall biosynthesis